MALPLHLPSFLMMSTCEIYPTCMLLTVDLKLERLGVLSGKVFLFIITPEVDG